jgi:hypothetical protein
MGGVVSGGSGLPSIGLREGTYRSGLYYVLGEGGDSTQSPLNNTMYATRFPVLRPCSLDRIGIEVITAGETGATIRMGIYGDDAEGDYPGALLADYGTVAATSTGRKEFTISQAIGVGLWWVVICVQNNAGAPATEVKMTSGYTPGAGGAFSDTSNLFAGGYKENTAATTGALPATFPTTENSTRTHKSYVRIV